MPGILSTTFVALSGIGFWLLWGTMALNGGSDAMMGTAAKGHFSDGLPVHNANRTGIWPLDHQMNVLIAFFASVSRLPSQGAPDTAPFLMLVDLTTALLVINFMVLVESRRRTGFWMRSPAIWQYLWNCGGVAVFLPIWALLYTKQRKRNGTAPVAPSEAAAFPWTAALSIALELPLMLPALLGGSGADVQRGIVLFFLGPLGFTVFQAGAAWIAAVAGGGRSSSKRGGGAGTIKAAYWVLGAVSGATHVGCVVWALSGKDGGLGGLARLFVPDDGAVYAAGTEGLLTEAAFLFLQWDYVIINVTVLLLGAHLLATRRPREASDGPAGSILAMVLLTVTGGPGVGLAYAANHEEQSVGYKKD